MKKVGFRMKCLQAREVVVTIRSGRRATPREFRIICPATWSKTALLNYVRNEHPLATVRIVDWKSEVYVGSWEPIFWLVNPEGFKDFKYGDDKPILAQGLSL